jgi:hypothetical protein
VVVDVDAAADLTAYGDIGRLVYKNMRRFCDKKVRGRGGTRSSVCVRGSVKSRGRAVQKPTEDVFNAISTGTLNKALTNLQPGLSAKVFRTYNASIVLERELKDLGEEVSKEEKVCVCITGDQPR